MGLKRFIFQAEKKCGFRTELTPSDLANGEFYPARRHAKSMLAIMLAIQHPGTELLRLNNCFDSFRNTRTGVP
jgi:hypothetical protein